MAKRKKMYFSCDKLRKVLFWKAAYRIEKLIEEKKIRESSKVMV